MPEIENKSQNKTNKSQEITNKPVKKEYEPTGGFDRGSLEFWLIAITTYLPKVNTLVQKTLLPLIDGILIDLFGGENKFKKLEGNLEPIMDKGGRILKFKFSAAYEIPDIHGVDVAPEAVKKDTDFVVSKLSKLNSPDLKLDSEKPVQFDLSNGFLYIKASISVGI
jgi:hypothetical protein